MPTRATVPPKAHPLVKTIFRVMAERGVTYQALADRSGLARETITAWRTRNKPDIESLDAVAGVLGLRVELVPIT